MKKIRKIMKELKKKDKGVSFAETIVVLAIMLLLTATIGISAFKYVDKAKVVTARNQILAFRIALNSYYLDCGVYPSTEQGLKALWEKPVLYPVPNNWNGPYIENQIKKDPWGGEYIYKNLEKHQGKTPFEILSYGSDGKEGGMGNEEDIISWNL